MRIQRVRGCIGAGLQVPAGYHDGVGGHDCRNAGTATLGGGKGAAATTWNSLGLHPVSGAIAISSRLGVHQLGSIGTVCLRSFDLIRRLFVLQRGLGDLGCCRLRLLERSGLRADHFDVGHRSRVEMPGHQRDCHEREIWPSLKRKGKWGRHQSADEAGHT